MSKQYEYSCSVCEKVVGRENLVVKKAVFTEIGTGASLVKSRTVSWLCGTCLRIDPDWLLDKFEAPGPKNRRG